MGGREEEVKILGFWASPFVHRVQWALNLKGIHYEYAEEDLWGGKSALLLSSNPVHKQVPVLIHNAKLVVDSLLILEYIDQTWVHRDQILPTDPYERAMARFWAKFVDEKIALSIPSGGAIGFVFIDDSSERTVLIDVGVDVPIFIFHSTHMINWLAAWCGATDAPDLVTKISSVIANNSYFTLAMMGFNHSDAKGNFGQSSLLMGPAFRAMCSSGEKKVMGANSVTESLDFLEGVLKGKKFFGVENVGYLDFALGWLAYMLEVWEEVGSMKIMDANKFPCLANWMKSFVDHPMIKDSLPPRDKMVVYFEERRKILASLFN
ncbi:hypothetical protein Syun_006660 [Stephania yunnanensis]|uniref:glutathione transferase n=1 Tax=Stephania yunnanensis TaxID=152371 RepID=A0AAP0L0F3_9MAGN